MRIRLHKNKPYGDYDYYPIYEIDYNSIHALSGYTTEYYSDSVGTEAYKYRQFSIANNLVAQYILGNVPINETSEGNIIPFWHRYNNIVSSRYTLPQDVLESFAAIQPGVQPDDWSTNPNYITLERESVLSHDILRPQCIRLGTTFDTQTAYYEDTKRTQLRMFYTDEGTSFSVSKSSFYNYNRWCPRTYTTGAFPAYYSGTQSYPQYAFTNSTSSVMDGHYHIDVPVGITAPATADTSWTNWESGYNCPMYFIHFVDSGVDFYGVALVQMDDFTESAVPVAMKVAAWDATFWGSSVFSGGEPGQGRWGNPKSPSISEGTFSERSESVTRDPSDPNSAAAIVAATNSSIESLFARGGAYRIYRLSTLVDNHSMILLAINALYSNSFWTTRWENKYFNPMSGVLNMGLIPEDFAEVETDMPIVRLIISGEDISHIIRESTSGIITDPLFNTYRPLVHKSFPTISLGKYFSGWADFAPYTKAVLHLPFIGKLSLNINEFAHGELGVEYVCDRTNGNVVAYIWASNPSGSSYENEIISQYVATANGNCLYTIPLYSKSTDYSGFGKMLSSAVSLGAGILQGSPSKAISSATGIATSTLDIFTAPQETSVSGQLGGNNCIMSPKEVWLELTRPNWVNNMHYQLLNGIPSQMSNCIADCSQDPQIPTAIPYSGYLQISHIELDNVNCTDSERSEIEALLKTGVYIRGEELLS